MSRIINSHDQIDAGDVYIAKSYSVGRDPRFNGWNIVGKGFDTDPDAPWYRYNKKHFSKFEDGNDRGKAALERAKQWVAENYGDRKWKRNKMGEYVDAKYPPIN